MTIFKYKLDKTRMFVVCYFCEHKRTHAGRIFASSFSTGPPGDRGALHCRWNVIATQPLGLVSFQARGIATDPKDDYSHAATDSDCISGAVEHGARVPETHIFKSTILVNVYTCI